MPDTRVEDEVPLASMDLTEIFYCVFGGAPHNVTAAIMAARYADPNADDGDSLGTTARRWSDLFLAPGGVINFANSDVNITHSVNALAFTGASNGYTFDASLLPAVSGGSNVGNATFPFANVFLASGGTINFANGDAVITHGADYLAFSGAASNGYSFDSLVRPASNDGAPLGSASFNWSDLFLASGSVINFNNSDVTITHSANLLALAGASSGYTFDAVIKPASNDGAALGVSGTAWADIFLASGAVINFNASDVTITHAADLLTVGGGDFVISNVTVASSSTTGAFRVGGGTGIAGKLFVAGNTTMGGSVELPTLPSSGTVDGVTCFAPGAGGGMVISVDGGFGIAQRRRTNNGGIQYFYRDTTLVGDISVTTTNTAYNTSSDETLKMRFDEDKIDWGARIDDLWVGAYQMIEEPGQWRMGVRGQQAYGIVPQGVTRPKNDDELFRVDYGLALGPLAMWGVKELRTRVAKIEAALGMM